MQNNDHQQLLDELWRFQVEASQSDDELRSSIVTLLRLITRLHQLFRQQQLSSVNEHAKLLFVQAWATLPLPWRSICNEDVHHIQLRRISGAYTNCVYAISLHDQPLLFRIYGKGLDVLFQRHDELLWMARLSQAHYGPRLYGCFRGGRFEQFLPSCTLTRTDIRESATMRVLAVQCARTHGLYKQWCRQNVLSEQERKTNSLWSRLRQWTRAALDAVPRLLAKHPNYEEQLNRLALSWLQEPSLDEAMKDISQLEQTFALWQSSLAFCHGDLQYGNVLQLLSNASIVFVDYEYALIAPPAFDLANHFCEWMADYQSDSPHRLQEDAFPSLAEQRDFLQVYLSTCRDLERQRKGSAPGDDSSGSEDEMNDTDNLMEAVSGIEPSSPRSVSSSHAASDEGECHATTKSGFSLNEGNLTPNSGFSRIESWRRQIMDYVALSHLLWGLWGLVQADQSTIQGFNYWAYALQRLGLFLRRRGQLFIQS